MTDTADVPSTSICLVLYPDGEAGEVVKPVEFKRDERGEGSIDDAAAALLGIDSDKVRCMQVPHIEKKLGLTLHFYFDLQGVEHGLPHNTNATQLYLIASLPDEPPDVVPASIHGPVLLSATDFKTEEYIDMTLGHWDQLKSMCLDVQPNAQFQT
ncbi:hypothetical protein V8C86DRAFT_2869116 [Haematococcus lacustris]